MVWTNLRGICLRSVQVASCVHSLFCWGQGASPAKIIAEALMRLLPEFPLQVQMLCPLETLRRTPHLQRPFLLALQILLPRFSPPILVLLASELM